jgi:hypothetical protein
MILHTSCSFDQNWYEKTFFEIGITMLSRYAVSTITHIKQDSKSSRNQNSNGQSYCKLLVKTAGPQKDTGINTDITSVIEIIPDFAHCRKSLWLT